MKAIETRYAGCRFRSRLEARWAVFFDSLNIEWKYEPEGYKILNGKYYLPDFYLPEKDIFVEVKGNMTHDDVTTLICAAFSGMKILVLRDIPKEESFGIGFHRIPYHEYYVPTKDKNLIAFGFTNFRDFLDLNKDDLFPLNFVSHVINKKGEAGCTPSCKDDGECILISGSGIKGISHSVVPSFYKIIKPCYDKARQARFEHGENG